MGARVALGLILLSALPACTSSQTVKDKLLDNRSGKPIFLFGRLWEDCGPTDEMLSGMTLTTVEVKCSNGTAAPEIPYVKVQFFEIGSAESKSAPVTVLWSNRKGTAIASRCLTAHSACDKAIGGRLDLSRPRPTLPSYELKFADGSVESGTFTPLAHCQPMVCG